MSGDIHIVSETSKWFSATLEGLPEVIGYGETEKVARADLMTKIILAQRLWMAVMPIFKEWEK